MIAGAPPCLPAPAALTAVVKKAVRFVSSHIAHVEQPQTCLSDSIPSDLLAVAWPGQVFFPTRDSWLLSLPPKKWDHQSLRVAMHEVLHQFGWRELTDADPSKHWIEEGVVEAVAQDVRKAWVSSVTRTSGDYGISYPCWVRDVRIASAVATGKPWRSRAARRWRVGLLLTAPNDRVMLPSQRGEPCQVFVIS